MRTLLAFNKFIYQFSSLLLLQPAVFALHDILR